MLNEEGIYRADRFGLAGLAYAYLGRNDEAVEAGEKAVETMPVSRDAFYGLQYVLTLAEIYTVVGEQDAAIEKLDYLLSIPCEVSTGYFRVDPIWDPLRDNPRFKEMMEKYSDGGGRPFRGVRPTTASGIHSDFALCGGVILASLPRDTERQLTLK